MLEGDTGMSWGTLGQLCHHRALQECSIPRGVLHPTGSAVAVSSSVPILGVPILGVPTLLSPSSAALPQELRDPQNDVPARSWAWCCHPPRGDLHISGLSRPGFPQRMSFVSHMEMSHSGDSHAAPTAWGTQSHLFKGRFPAKPSGKELD